MLRYPGSLSHRKIPLFSGVASLQVLRSRTVLLRERYFRTSPPFATPGSSVRTSFTGWCLQKPQRVLESSRRTFMRQETAGGRRGGLARAKDRPRPLLHPLRHCKCRRQCLVLHSGPKPDLRSLCGTRQEGREQTGLKGQTSAVDRFLYRFADSGGCALAFCFRGDAGGRWGWKQGRG